MSNSADVEPGENKDVPGAGSSTDQHVTGAAETGTFITDKAPSGDTQAHGSSDSGVTAVRTGDDTAQDR